MASVLRPRVDAVVIISGVQHEVSTSLRDTIELKKAVKSLTGDGEDVAHMVYFACKRKGLFDGTWDEFADAVDDIEVSEPPPLKVGENSQDS